MSLKSSYHGRIPTEDTAKKNKVTRNAFRSNGITAQLFPPWTRDRTIYLELFFGVELPPLSTPEHVISLKSSYYGGTPTGNTS